MSTGTSTTSTSTTNAPTPPAQQAQPGQLVSQILQMAGNSSCASYSWKNRGRAPAGYVKGIALSFARSVCRLNNNTQISSIMSQAATGNDSKDALTHYQSVFNNLSMPVNSAGIDSLRAVYTLGTGLGMRESSGTYCEGWDKSAGSSRASSAAEAGLFQTSYDSMGISSELSKLYAEYQNGPSERCYLNTFKQGASCSDLSTLGTGAGVVYQNFNKSCPAFAAEYAMTMLRINRAHYGPINRLEAEVIPACEQLYKEVEDLVMSDVQTACQEIN
jgi:hypothetical protein